MQMYKISIVHVPQIHNCANDNLQTMVTCQQRRPYLGDFQGWLLYTSLAVYKNTVSWTKKNWRMFLPLFCRLRPCRAWRACRSRFRGFRDWADAAGSRCRRRSTWTPSRRWRARSRREKAGSAFPEKKNIEESCSITQMIELCSAYFEELCKQIT